MSIGSQVVLLLSLIFIHRAAKSAEVPSFPSGFLDSEDGSITSCHHDLHKTLTQSYQTEDNAQSFTLKTCRAHWEWLTQMLLSPYEETGISQDLTEAVPTSIPRYGLYGPMPGWNLFGGMHTMLRLRVRDNKLFCVKDPRIRLYKFMFPRAEGYVKHILRFIRRSRLPDLDIFVQFGDRAVLSKLHGPLANVSLPPPLLSIAGNPKQFHDIPGVPFYTLLRGREGRAFDKYRKGAFEARWARRKPTAFFSGVLSDCGAGLPLDRCARAKAAVLANDGGPSMRNIRACAKPNEMPRLRQRFGKCRSCISPCISPARFTQELLRNRIVLDFDGSAPWSKRMIALANCGALVMRHDTYGMQFFEYGLREGEHIVPFTVDPGREGCRGNVENTVAWLNSHPQIAMKIAKRLESFASICLTEQSLDNFVGTFLRQMGELQAKAGGPANNYSGKKYLVELKLQAQGQRGSSLRQCFARFLTGGVGKIDRRSPNVDSDSMRAWSQETNCRRNVASCSSFMKS